MPVKLCLNELPSGALLSNTKINVRYKFPRNIRLLNEGDYTAVFREGSRVKSANFVGHIKANSLSRPRLGLAISKKVCKQAPGRNKIKRAVREFFRLNQHRFDGKDFIILATPKTKTLSRRELNNEVEMIFEKLTQRMRTN